MEDALVDTKDSIVLSSPIGFSLLLAYLPLTFCLAYDSMPPKQAMIQCELGIEFHRFPRRCFACWLRLFISKHS